MRIVVLGGGFSGLNAAYWLTRKWPANQHEVVLVAENEHFVFKPSLIWVPFDRKKIDHIIFPLAAHLAQIGVAYIQDKVIQVLPDESFVVLEKGDPLSYDFLIVATGGVPDWGAVPGLRGQTLSLYDIDGTLKATKKIRALRPGDPVVIGIAKQNTLPSIAYEFLFELDEYLREAKIKAPITFFTYEQQLLEQAGSAASEKVEKRIKEKPFHIYRGVQIQKVRRGHIHLDHGLKLPYALTLITPRYKGAEFVFASKQLEHENGLLKTNDHLQVNGHSNVYAAGDSMNGHMKGAFLMS